LVVPHDVEAVLTAVRTRGYCVVEGLIPESEAEALRLLTAGLAASERDDHHARLGHQRIIHIAAKDSRFLTPLCHPFVMEVWSRYLGPDFMCSTWTANTVLAGAGKVYWHADHPYWTTPSPYPTWPLCGHVIWCLSDFTLENGATAGFPGSHLRGELPSLEDGWPPEAEVLTAPKGSVIFAEGAWWHTSTPNRTGEDRHALLAAYIRPFCIPQEPMDFQLADITQPSELVLRLFGAALYRPRIDKAY
jgi:ectoine hydroxylase-related dioxygenase (phytanoyl-CoA dioxygenase family)